MPESNSPYPNSYSQEDIQEILQLAIANHQTEEELSRQQLWEIAAELDISQITIQEAEQQWLSRKTLDSQHRAFNLHRRQKFQQKLAKYGIINGFLMAFNFLAASTLSWSLYIVLFWGLGVALRGWQAYQTQGESYEKAFKRWHFQNGVKQTVTGVWTKVQQVLSEGNRANPS